MNIRALLISITLTLLPAFAVANDCHIDSEIWFSTGYEQQDEYLCTLNWAVTDYQYLPSLPNSGADGTCQVIVDLVGENDYRLETLVVDEDGKAQIWHAGRWYSMIKFEAMTLARGCESP
jgi:hypothetical protein